MPSISRCAMVTGAVVLVIPVTASATVTVADRKVTEGNGPGVVTFSLVREAAAFAGQTSVTVATQDGTAKAPGDYSVAKGTVTFPGQPLFGAAQRIDISIPIIGDTVHEPDEAFGLKLSGPEISNPLALAFIKDDDPAPPPPPAGTPVAPAAAPTPAPPAAATAAPPRIGLATPRLQRPSLVKVTVTCPVQLGTCQGTMALRSRAEKKSRFKSLRSARELGSRRFTLTGGRSRTLRIRLKGKNLQILDAVRRMRVQARVSVIDQAGRKTTRRATGLLVARLSASD